MASYRELSARIEQDYCLGMADPIYSWAGGGKANPVAGRPGVEGYEWISPDGKTRITDQFSTHPITDTTRGEIILWHNKIIEVTVSLLGTYHKEVLPFLKEALLWNATRSIFGFGRGPENYSTQGLRYSIQRTDKDFAAPNMICAIEKIESSRTSTLYGMHYVFVTFPGRGTMHFARPALKLEMRTVGDK